MGKMQPQPVYSNDTSFEKIWAILDRTAKRQEETAKRQEETDRLMKESQKETDRLIKETAKRQEETAQQMKETDRLMKESQKETDRIIKEIGKNLGDFTNRFGEVVEYMVAPNLQDKFRDMGLDFQEASTNHKVRDYKNDIEFEIDVFLQNGDTAMLVEIKTKLTITHINDHIKRLEKMRKYADLRGDKRHFLGAVAGVVVPANAKEYALKKGLYFIEPSGETFNITSPRNKPKKW